MCDKSQLGAQPLFRLSSPRGAHFFLRPLLTMTLMEKKKGELASARGNTSTSLGISPVRLFLVPKGQLA